MRPDASENSQINPSTIVRASRAAGRHPHLASVLLQGRKSANIHASSGVIRGIPVNFYCSLETTQASEIFTDIVRQRLDFKPNAA